jgi:septum site-determining protein MinC
LKTEIPALLPLELKGASVSAVRLRLASLDESWLRAEIERALGGAPDFFDSELAVLDLAHVADQDEPPDWRAIAELLSARGLVLGAVANAGEGLRKAAVAAGLAVVSLGRPGSARPSPPAAPPKPAAAATLIADRPLRSGQQIYAREGDAVLLAQASAGSEVIAAGSIHVYAPLRGRALAGAHGDHGARILTTCFEAELVSIAGVYQTFDAGLPPALARRPVQVRCEKNAEGQLALVIEPLSIA